MKVSVCMIVKNEEKHIRRALGSIPPHFEIVVVDTGCTDRTMDIVSQFPANACTYEWRDDFAAARNASIAQATGDYVLVMDADEELPDDVSAQIEAFVMNHPSSPGAVLIANIIEGEIRKHRMVRFFPRDSSYSFVGIVHETLQKDDQSAEYHPMDLTINHYGYNEQDYNEKNKANAYSQLYKKHLQQYPNDGYMHYQMGKLLFSLKRYEEAESYLRNSWSIRKEGSLYYPVMLVMLGYVLEAQGKSNEAEALLTPYLTHYNDFPDLPFLLGILAMNTGKAHLIETYYLRALAIGETSKYSSVEGVGSFKAAYNLALFYELFGHRERAIRYYRQAASHQYAPAIERLKNL